MKRKLSIASLIALALTPDIALAQRPILKGSTDQSVVIRIVDATDGTPETGVEHNSSGIDLWYRREGATKTSITEVALSALNDAHSDGGIEHIGDGYYRLDLPDAGLATGANGVLVGGTVTGMVVIGTYCPLVSYDPYDGVRLGLTALPNAAANTNAGLPILSSSGTTLAYTLSTVTTYTGNTPQTGDNYARLGAPVGATISADIAAAHAVVNSGTHGNAALKTLIDALPTNSELHDELTDVIILGGLSVEDFSEQAAPLLIANGMASNYAAGRVWVDTDASIGETGTAAFLNGTANSPARTVEDAFDIAANSAVKLRDFNIANGSSIQLSETSTAKNFVGRGWSLDLNGKNIGGSYFEGASVIGTGTGTAPVFDHCSFGDVTLPPTVVANTSFGGTFAASANGHYLFVGGNAAKSTAAEPTFNFAAGGITLAQVNFRKWSGGINIVVKQGVTVNLNVASGGVVTLTGDGGSGATVNISGAVQSVVDNTTGTVTVNQDGRN